MFYKNLFDNSVISYSLLYFNLKITLFSPFLERDWQMFLIFSYLDPLQNLLLKSFLKSSNSCKFKDSSFFEFLLKLKKNFENKSLFSIWVQR